MSVDLSRRFALSPHADVKTRGGEPILVLPERALRVGGSGSEMLELCRVPRTGLEIVRELTERYPETPGLEAEVAAFLREMIDLGGISCENDKGE